MWHSNHKGRVQLIGGENIVIEHMTEDLIPGVVIAEIGFGATIHDAIITCIKLAIEFDVMFTFEFNGYIMNIDKNSSYVRKLEMFEQGTYV